MRYRLQLYNNTLKAFNALPIIKSLFNARLNVYYYNESVFITRPNYIEFRKLDWSLF